MTGLAIGLGLGLGFSQGSGLVEEWDGVSVLLLETAPDKLLIEGGADAILLEGRK